MLDFFFYTCMALFILTCLLLILIVLIQKGRGGGLASAFGGMGGNTAFGSKTGDVLTWATSAIFLIFLLLAITLNWMANYRHSTYLQTRGGAAEAATTPADGTGSMPDAPGPDPVLPLDAGPTPQSALPQP
jgi:preprotein translocase subunit SecG